MGANEIIRELDRKAKNEAAASQRRTDKQVAEILAKAEEDGNQLRLAAKEKADAEARHIATLAASARLEAERTRANARMDAYGIVAEQVKKSLNEMAKDKKAYEKYIRNAVEQGRATVGDDFVIQCNKRDAAIARKYGQVAQKPIETQGGVIVSSPDGKVRADSTFESLLVENAEDILREAKNAMGD